jgi:hypothetical protein
VQSFAAEGARAVGVGGWDDDDVTDVHGADVIADGFDDADGLVSHAAAGLAGLHLVVRPEVAAADGSVANGDKRVGRLDQASVGDVLDANVTGAVHDGCPHRDLPRAFGELELVDRKR